jgi:hypothetical protein
MTCTSKKLHFRDHNKNNVADRACGTNGRKQRCIQGSVGEVGEKRSLGKHKPRFEENIENEPSRNRIGFGPD